MESSYRAIDFNICSYTLIAIKIYFSLKLFIFFYWRFAVLLRNMWQWSHIKIITIRWEEHFAHTDFIGSPSRVYKRSVFLEGTLNHITVVACSRELFSVIFHYLGQKFSFLWIFTTAIKVSDQLYTPLCRIIDALQIIDKVVRSVEVIKVWPKLWRYR